MNTPKSWPFRGIVALVALLLFTPLAAHADTYSIVPLANDNRFLHGMDDAGHVVFDLATCAPGISTCSEVFLNGVNTGVTNGTPLYAWDFSSKVCSYPTLSSPCTLSYKGTAMTLTVESDLNTEDLFVTNGSGIAQFLLRTHGIGGIFAVDGIGDIVFDNQLQDEWYEAVDLTTAVVPEPSSLLLLATGALALAGFSTLRRHSLT